MTGEVTALQAEFDGAGTFTVLRGYDAAHRLLRGRRSEAYTQMTASDIAQQLAQRAGIPLGEVTSTSTVYEHVSQVGTSDWYLLRWLAADAGFDITVRDGEVRVRPPGRGRGRAGRRRSRRTRTRSCSSRAPTCCASARS